mmetsp:Transcript_56707/g.143666  ORF Transcript_56707/g.143666 Transcript_56707/m.143666 type:complete len:251 (-) Transcript_56707:953-1705(-)
MQALQLPQEVLQQDARIPCSSLMCGHFGLLWRCVHAARRPALKLRKLRPKLHPKLHPGLPGRKQCSNHLGLLGLFHHSLVLHLGRALHAGHQLSQRFVRGVGELKHLLGRLCGPLVLHLGDVFHAGHHLSQCLVEGIGEGGLFLRRHPRHSASQRHAGGPAHQLLQQIFHPGLRHRYLRIRALSRAPRGIHPSEEASLQHVETVRAPKPLPPPAPPVLLSRGGRQHLVKTLGLRFDLWPCHTLWGPHATL